MPGPLEAAGALPEPSEYATLSMDRHITGLWTQRSPLRDADVPYIYGKFYSASRFDSLIDGINREITARLTDARRCGTSPWSNGPFPPMNSFYAFHTLINGVEQIRVMGDGKDGWLWDCTGNIKVWQKVYTTKLRFLGLVNELIFCDGQGTVAKASFNGSSWSVSNMIGPGPANAPGVVNVPLGGSYPTWQASTYYSPAAGYQIVDPNKNLQQVTVGGQTGSNPPTWNATPGGTTTDGSLTWTNMGSADWQPSYAYNVGDLMSRTWTEVIAIKQGGGGGGGGLPPALLQAGAGVQPLGYTYVYEYITRSSIFQVVQAGTSGASPPMKQAPDGSQEEAWGSGVNSYTNDNTVIWQNVGASKGWPGTKQSISTDKKILDSNGYVQQVVHSGQSGATAPTWSTTVGGQTQDNTVLWSNAGALTVGNSQPWIYCYAFKASATGDVTSASPLSVPIILAPNSFIQVQGVGSPYPQYDTVEIYRTALGQATPVFLADIPITPGANSVWTYNDTSGSDSVLTPQLPAPLNNVNDPAPSGMTAPCWHLGRVFGIALNNVVYSRVNDPAVPGNAAHAYPPLNTIPCLEQPIRLFSTVTSQGPTLLVWCIANIYAIFGDGTAANPFTQPVAYMGNVGISNYDAVHLVGSTYYAFTGTYKLVSLDPGAGYIEAGFPIGDQFTNVTTGAGSAATGALYNPASTYVTWAEYSSGDSALYVSDGSVGWFRFSPVASPESGYLWSPRAAILGGTSAVQSIEVTPGVYRLLIAPASGTGPILQRDTTVFTDWVAGAAQPYPAYDVKGNIVLCLSGQVAEIAHIGLKSKAVGSRPKVWLLLGELTATQNVPWDQLAITSTDPPDLPPSVTMFSDRYTALQNGVAPKCDNFQLKVDYGSQNAGDELLMYSIYGAKHSERKQQ
jgi:hypothetical protein